MWILYWAIIGLIAGTLAKFLMPGKDPGGCIITILLGVAGSFVGGFIAKSVFGASPSGLLGLATAVGGAMLLLLA